MTGPGEDTCLSCHHPDRHDDEEPCGALCGTGRYGSDGIEVTRRCGCTGWYGPALLGVVAPDPWTTQGPVPKPPF